MKNFNIRIFVTAFLFTMFSFCGYAQERTCNMVEYMEEMLKDPKYAKEYEENQRKFKARLDQYLAQENFNRRMTIEIPVAVHFPEANEADRACLEALAQNQIDILNADYTATNSDFSQWTNSASAFFPSTNAGIANISFCIATFNHPTGLDPELLEGNPAVTIGYNFGGGNNSDSNWSGYLNFVIKEINFLGFSPLGGSIAAGQAVTMDNNAFGSGIGCSGSGVVPSLPYNLGRTTTHELGHFFNLNHTFNADGGGVCGTGGDGIADTPEVANSTYGCPPDGSVASCLPGQAALTMNYMDYVNDACMYMFSEDQIEIAEAWIMSNLESAFKPNVCSLAAPGFSLTAQETSLFSCPETDTQKVFNFSYTTDLNFDETTTFSVTGLPAGATATFSPTSLNSDGDFTLTVGNLGATAQGTYTIAVTGRSLSLRETVNVVLENSCTEIICTPYITEQNLGIAIPDPSNGNAGVATHILNVPDSNIIYSMTLSANISHTWISDLELYIIPPGGTFANDAIRLWDNECGVSAAPGYQNFEVTFDDNGPNFPGTDGCNNNFTGTYKPNEALGAFSGNVSQGNWELVIVDFFDGDTGTLNNWSVDICYQQPLSLNDLTLANISIYPNPNSGEFNIGFNPQSGQNISIEVYDIRGRAIFTKRYDAVSRFEEVVKLNNAESGVYLLSISDGAQKVTKKIVVD